MIASGGRPRPAPAGDQNTKEDAIVKTLLIKLDRISAWALVAFMAAFFVTGYGQTKEIIPPDLAKFVHDDLLPMPSIIAFAFHSAYGMHISLKRWKVWGRPWSVALAVYAVALVVGVFIAQFVVQTGAELAVPQEIEL